MGTDVLSLRMDGELLERLRQHAAKRGMSVQDYVVRTLIRDDFDERFKAAVDETEKFYGGTERSSPATAEHGDQVSPSAGIR
ncbi:ribbon-helix-helix protein, CopG family [Streptomyces triticagri]|uniref:Ribbon-helix-helix protein, CopG family n=1 Tax=Streptomyces triticagri TaxID=2293568 RepID=A0A372M300_9ACTN|nr:ribbon-helix-helix protein, CopG family [Streptomyces triticagri]RFU85294.1 ribbon-helix-helix protein, CopG family [Streptomyces triticagri]